MGHDQRRPSTPPPIPRLLALPALGRLGRARPLEVRPRECCPAGLARDWLRVLGGRRRRQPTDWLQGAECHGVWGTRVRINERKAIPLYERPANRSDAFAFDQKLDAAAWAAAGAPMARARARH